MRENLRQMVKSSPLLMRIARPLSHIKTVGLMHIPITGPLPPVSEKAHLDAVSFGSFAQFQEWTTANGDRIAEWECEDEGAFRPGKDPFSLRGLCAICNAIVDFRTTIENGKENSVGETRPNWREGLICPQCGMCNRVRAALHLAIQNFDLTPDKQIYTTEQVGLVYRWLRGHFTHVLGSEYLPPGQVPGFRRLGINHQDVQALSLAAASVDCVITLDVLEHVPDHSAAFASFARVLRPGGRLVITAPFTINKFDTTVRAEMLRDGRIKHFMPEEIHGNPLDPSGSLCFRHFGWDVLEQLTEAGFADPGVHVYHNRYLGYLGGQQSLISAIKA